MRNLSHAPERHQAVDMPPHDGIHSIIENTMPSDCAQSGSAV